MSALPKTRNFLQALGALGITAALSALLLWYYDAFAVYWQPNSYPYCVAVIVLFAAALKLLQQWVRGVRGKALVGKILISLAIFPGLTLLAVSFLVNNVVYGAHKPGAHVAVAVAFPLSAAYILLQDALLFFALRKQGSKGAWVLPAGILAVPLAIAAAMCLNAFYRVPQKEITPIFPEAQMVQEAIPSDEEEDDDVNTVWLDGGTYTALELPSLSNVTYRSRPGEEVVVTGSIEITGWQADSVNGVDCWSAPWSFKKVTFTSLYHPDPDKQLRRPRYPAEGYLFVDHTDGAKAVFTKETAPWDLTRGHTSLFAKEGDLRQFYALEDVTLRVLHAWKDEISNLVSYDDTTRELVWERPAAMTVNPNDRYFLENVFEELKEPGQWYLDDHNEKLYYIPFAGEDMESTVLYAGGSERLLTVDGAENVTFRGITFKDSAWNFPDSNWLDVEGMDSSQAAVNVHPCILVTNSTGVNFENCKFENIGATALKFGENVHGSGVTGSEFTYIGGNAVFIEGLFDAPNSEITVKNNLIAHYGRRFFNAIGVLNIHAHHVEIANNEITDGYYSAVSSGWVWGYSENPTDYVTIENNLIYRIGQGWLSDMGGIYTLGMQPHSVIRGNVIHDVAADPLQGGYGGWGIYPDEGSTGQLIEKNLVYDCGSQSFHQHYGRENIVRNNIFAFSGEGQIRVSRKEEHTSIFLEGNIIVSDGQPIYTSVQKGKFIDGGNLYYDYARPGQLFSGDGGEMGILRMRGMGYYKNALVADPLFRDVGARDFTLALNSPAVEKIGFEAWDYGQAGRQAQPPTTEPAPAEQEWAVITPPLDYEIINGFAKTPTHYYAAHDGGIVRAPIGDIAKQTRIPLPEKYEGMKLEGAEICGITEEWLFVNIWEAREKIRHEYDGGYYETEDYEDRTCVTYRIAMGSWEAEAIAAGKYGEYPLPWYNAVSGSLLIPLMSEDGWIFEAMSLNTRKRIPVGGAHGGWWCNTIDGRAVKRDFTFGDESDIDNCYVYDANNQAQLTRLRDLNFPKHWDWRKKEAPKNKAEEDLLSIPRGEIGWINEYVTCGEYVYYVQRDYDTRQNNFYRVNTDGTERKLLRENTTIDYLVSTGSKLLCEAYHPTEVDEWGNGKAEFYLLDMNGKVVDVLLSYWVDDQGNVGNGLLPYGDKVMVIHSVIYCPPSFTFLYDPATGARFPAQEG